jgi:hypothetical protein
VPNAAEPQAQPACQKENLVGTRTCRHAGARKCSAARHPFPPTVAKRYSAFDLQAGERAPILAPGKLPPSAARHLHLTKDTVIPTGAERSEA